jgi:two-component system, NarL family, response regulator DevR
MINVLLADDHQYVRRAISELLKSDTDVRLVGEASSLRETLDLTAVVCPDVVVMDIHMGDEQNVKPSDLKSRLVDCRLLAMSLWTDEETKILAESFGAVTLLDKTKLATELLPSLRQYGQGRGIHLG